jgi:hypothetical protein
MINFKHEKAEREEVENTLATEKDEGDFRQIGKS